MSDTEERWVKCTDRLPPNNENFIILNTKPKIKKTRGSMFHMLYGRKNDKLSWTPYSEELWAELNKKRLKQ